VGSELLPIIVVVAALAFDFTNGFHDTANAMATSIATGALKPRVAVAIAAVMNLLGAVLSTTIATGIVDADALAGLVAIAGTLFAYQLVARLRAGAARRGYRLGQIGSASLVSLAHGTNDAQKTMGIITLALIAHGNLDSDNFTVPFWVKASCGLAIAAGTYAGGLADHQHDGQPPDHHRIAAGLRRRVLRRVGHPRVLVLRLPAVDHARRLRRRHRVGHRQAPGLGPLGHRRSDGQCLAAHHPRRGGRGSGGLGSLPSLRPRQRRTGDRRPRRSGARGRPLRRRAAHALAGAVAA
jgi:phosphate transporter family protein